MTNPQITFRLTNRQLAHGLKLVRLDNPGYTPVSLSQLVKLIYINCIDKTVFNKADEVTDLDIAEIHNIANSKSTTQPMSLADFQQATERNISASIKAHTETEANHD